MVGFVLCREGYGLCCARFDFVVVDRLGYGQFLWVNLSMIWL